ncbi:MCE family protein [Mycobacterium sp. MBM]|nr:MCE family protein [Mycobacterium sp. MBM]
MTATRRRQAVSVAVVLIVVLVAGVLVLIRESLFESWRVTAYFTSATAIYPGDEVRVVGVKVGTIASIETDGTKAELVLDIDHGVRVPADARAVIVAPNLISARYVQLTPAYIDSGATMADGSSIPLQRTAVPVEWDEVKDQLSRLATDLGPSGIDSQTSAGRFLESAADAMDDNGARLRQTLEQLSASGRIVSEGGDNLVDIVRNLQQLVSALRESNTQIVEFQGRFATLTSVVNESRSDLDSALTTLSSAIDDAKRFVSGSRNQASEQVHRLADLTQILVDQRSTVENILHAAPTSLANTYNMYNPDMGTFVGSFVFQNFSNPLQLLCSGIGAVENATAPETGRLCAEYLGPALRLTNFNYIPIPVNPLLAAVAQPENLVYSDPRLAPGGGGMPPGPPEMPPAVSAYTGSNGDVAAPPGYGPVPQQNSVDTLLLPDTAPELADTAPDPPRLPAESDGAAVPVPTHGAPPS